MMITSIDNMQELVTLAKIHPDIDWRTYGDVSVKEQGDLLLFSYTSAAQFHDRWNFFEKVSRGLIINKKTGEIVARPFDKFFNWGENGKRGTGHIVNVTEKMDGSLGIMYHEGDQFKIATRGSFDSEQAVWATNFLNKNFSLARMPKDLTLMFEIVYPDNRVVVNYGDRKDLILLAARNRLTGEYLPFFPRMVMMADFFGFSLVPVFNFNNVGEIIEKAGDLDISKEGWVIEMSDGTRWKLKGDRYLELHKLVSGLTFNKAIEAFRYHKIEDLLKEVPDEFLTDFKLWIAQIQAAYSEKRAGVQNLHDQALKELTPVQTRKDYALWMKKNAPREMMPYMFLVYDMKEWKLRDIILKSLEKQNDTDKSESS